MTRVEILALKSGRELDVLVAEYVFGWCKVPGPKTDYDGPCESYDVLVPPTIDDPFPLFPPKGVIMPWWFCDNWSTNISAAWEAVDTMRKNGYTVNLMGRLYGYSVSIGVDWVEYRVLADAPGAICKAALLAKLGREVSHG